MASRRARKVAPPPTPGDARRPLTLYTLADFGSAANLKTEEANHLIAALRDDLQKVYCRRYVPRRRRPPMYATVPMGSPIFKALSFLNMIQPFIRFERARIYDLIASRLPCRTGFALFHPFTFVRTQRRLRSKGLVTIAVGTNAVGKRFYDVEKEERRRLGIRPLAYDPFYEEGILSASYVIAYSTHAKESYAALGVPKERIFVIPPGVDAARFRPGKKRDKKFRLLMVADFTVMKGAQYLLEAWRDLALSDAELVLVGVPLAEMCGLFSGYRREVPSVRFIGHTDNLLPYYQQASAFVFPSLAEGWGKVVSEALACGLPVITTTETGAKDAIQDGVNGFIVPARDVTALKERIRWLHEHPKEAARMGEAARRTGISYSWSRFERGVKRAFQEIRRREEVA